MMRRLELCCAAITGAVGLCSGGCGDPGTVTANEPLAQSQQALVLVVPSTSMDDVRTTILAAQAGQKVVFKPGLHKLDEEAFEFKSGVTFVGDAGGTTRFRWEERYVNPLDTNPNDDETRRLEHYGDTAVKNVTIKNITFEKIALEFRGQKTKFSDSSNVYLKDLTFKNGTGDGWGGDGYISLKYTDGVVIDNCTFLRSSKWEGGRGIRSYHAHNTIIKDSFIGTTKHLPDGATDGHFRVAINVLNRWEFEDAQPRSENVKVDNTVLRRIHNPDCSVFKLDDEGNPERCLSHGIYASYYDGFELTRSRLDGWAANGGENVAKLRNSQNTFVFDNHFMRSGLHLYTDTGAFPEHLVNVHVRGNRFHITECAEHPDYCGIRVARNTAVSNDEENIYLTDNTFAGLGVVQVDDSIDGPAVCAQNNVGATTDFQAPGVRTSGCVPGSWDRPLAGVFSGYFNDDGIKDTATRVKIGGAWTWRVYASNGDGYDMLDFGDGALPTEVTEKYGVHVGDFTENGRDDIAYYGRCGDNPCWRVHASQGTSFITKFGFGDGMFHTDETFRFGVHVGDFDGDGYKDDLVYRGQCGSPAVPCWRVHKSDSATFSVHNFGNDAVWYGNESEIYGLLIGNFDGDANGRDDIAYLGKCGTARCIRVHLSTGSAFVYQSSWDQGAGTWRDGPEITEHFGMQVGDMNDDGKADIGYRGLCGSSTKQWRYHRTKPTGNGFEIVCDNANLF